MNAETKRRTTEQIREALEAHFAQVHYVHAALLAKSGHLVEAEALLCRRGVPKIPQNIDLLARIAVKRRDLKRAEKLWQYALKLEPGNSTYSEALLEIRDVEHFQELVSPSANFKRLAEFIKKAASQSFGITKSIWCRFMTSKCEIAQSPSADTGEVSIKNPKASSFGLAESETAQPSGSGTEMKQ